MDENKDLSMNYEVLNGVIELCSGMYGMNDTDYGRGIQCGILSTLRALGIAEDFKSWLAERNKAQEEAE